MAFSAGFHPHPRISYANAAPTGTASEAEYVELALSERVDPEAVRAALDEALPTGLDVLQVVEASGGSLADRLEASDWAIAAPGLDADTVQAAVDAYLAVDRAEVTRTFKTGPKTFDTRSAVVAMRVAAAAEVAADVPQAVPAGDPACAILRVVVRHTTPAVRPDDVLNALQAVAALAPPTPPLVTRLAQGPLRTATATVADPLATDQDADGI